MYMHRRDNTTKKRARSRTESKELKVSKKLREYNSSTSEDSEDISDNEIVREITKKESVTMATTSQQDNVQLDLNILKDPRAIQQLFTIFQPFLDGIETRLVKRIDNLEEKLENHISNTNKKFNDLETRLQEMDRIEKLDQLSRQNNLIFCGIKETKNESTDKEIVEFVNKNIPSTEIKLDEIDCSFRIGKTDEDSTKPRPILVKFKSYDTRKKIYKNKKELRENPTKMFINEDLTPKKSVLFSKVRKLKKDGVIFNAWTHDSVVYYTNSDKDTEPKSIRTEEEIETIRKNYEDTQEANRST